MKNKATSNIKICQVLSFLSLNKVGTCLRDGLFSIDIGNVNLHPSKGTHWVAPINENYFDSYGCLPPQKLFIIKRNGHCLNCEYKIQGLTKKTKFLLCKFLFRYNLSNKSDRYSF